MASTSPGYGITIRVDGPASAQPVSEITQAILAAGAAITALDVVESVLDRVVIDVTCDAIDAEHAEAEPPAQIAIPRVALAALAAGRNLGRDPYLVGSTGAIDRLQDQFQIEGELELSNHDNGRIIAAQRHEVTAADLALHREAELFEEAFDGRIKRGFQQAGSCGIRPRLGAAA